jgi:hypothetical protein
VATEAALYKADKTPAQVFGYGSRETMGVLSRYEVTLERGMYKALHELQRLQAARNGEFLPPPEAVDIEVAFATDSEPNELALNSEIQALAVESIKTDAKA